MLSQKTKSIFHILIILALFIFFSYIIQTNLEFLKSFIGDNQEGMIIFIIIIAASIVLAPISAVPLFPLASGLWGWITTAILGIIGWTIGASIAFLLARKYGSGLVNKFLPVEKLQNLEKKIPKNNLFLTVVLLRMVIPVDGLSYLLGLFSSMSFGAYFLATLIGIIPFTFVIAYLGTVPFAYQISFTITALIIFAMGILIAYARRKIKIKSPN
ncbi:MAG: VTT domain-containing protein [Nanoarchaeota archaeon]